MTWGLAISLAVAAVCGVVSLWLILSFFWKVYEHGGEKDLSAAAKAVRKVYDPRWLDKLTGFLPDRQSKVEENDDALAGGDKKESIEAAGAEDGAKDRAA